MKINDFEHFCWTQVQDFAKIVEFLERSLSRYAIFSCFLNLDQVLERCLPRFGIVVMILQRFFNFRTIFDDFDRDDTLLVKFLTRSLSCFGILSIRKIVIFHENQRFRSLLLDSSPGFCQSRRVFGAFFIVLCNFFVFLKF